MKLHLTIEMEPDEPIQMFKLLNQDQIALLAKLLGLTNEPEPSHGPSESDEDRAMVLAEEGLALARVGNCYGYDCWAAEVRAFDTQRDWKVDIIGKQDEHYNYRVRLLDVARLPKNLAILGSVRAVEREVNLLKYPGVVLGETL